MEISIIRALSFLVLFFCTSSHTTARTTNTTTTDFSCSVSSGCDTYVVYRAQSPEFLNPGRVSDLFGVSRLSITKASNLSSEDAQLPPGQLLLVPVSCGCTGNRSFANITYDIKKDDSFYLISTATFEHLTDYHAVEALNPTLNPTNLTVGQEVIFPVFCKCPSKAQMEQGVKFLITYVWQAEDDVEQLSSRMNSSADAMSAVNGYRSFSSAAVDRPVLIPVSKLPVLPQIPPSSHHTSSGKKSASHRRVLVIVSCTAGAALVSASGCLLMVYVYSRCGRFKKLVRTRSTLESSVDLLQFKNSRCPKVMQDKLLIGVSNCLDKPVVYQTEAIMEGTRDLDERYRIGGSVFRATVDGEVFAVKRARGDVTEELKILRKVNHRNLVKLMGISTDTNGDFFLVYEYAENGSLDKWLHPEVSRSSSSASFLSWRQRLITALDVANGLQYMHEHTSPSIVHGDVRTSNILLDGHFKAKISNFSMARPATAAVTPNVDVFAFGVVLLELLSGKKAMETRGGGEMEMSTELELVGDGSEERLEKWMDPNLEGFYPVEGALSLVAMARACTSEKPSERPSMGEIVFGLSVLAQSCAVAFERTWTSNLEENVDQIIKSVVLVAAR